MNILSNIGRQMIISYKNNFGYYDLKLYLLDLITGPIFRILLFVTAVSFAYKTNDLSKYIISNSLLLSSMSAIYGGGTVLRNERYLGTMSVIIATPFSRVLLVVSKISVFVLDGILKVVIGLIICKFVFGADYSRINIYIFSLIILISVLSATGLGFLVSCFGLIVRDITLINNTVYSVLLVLTGANYNIEKLPMILQKIAIGLPLTNSIKAINQIISGNGLTNIWHLLFNELLIGCSYFVIGIFMFKFLEYKAVKKGELDFY